MTAYVTAISLSIAIPALPTGIVLLSSKDEKDKRAGKILTVVGVIFFIIGGALLLNMWFKRKNRVIYSFSFLFNKIYWNIQLFLIKLDKNRVESK